MKKVQMKLARRYESLLWAIEVVLFVGSAPPHDNIKKIEKLKLLFIFF